MKTATASIISSKTDSSGGSINIAIECATNGNVERFTQCFDNETDPFHDSVVSLINTRSTEDNKSALDWAALIGNIAMVSELIKRGADINAVSEKGRLHHYEVVLLTALHSTFQFYFVFKCSICNAFIVSTISIKCDLMCVKQHQKITYRTWIMK